MNARISAVQLFFEIAALFESALNLILNDRFIEWGKLTPSFSFSIEYSHFGVGYLQLSITRITLLNS
jgi:hypothetical protein